MTDSNLSSSEYPNLVLLNGGREVSGDDISGSAIPEAFSAPNAAGELRKVNSTSDVRKIAEQSALNFKKMLSSEAM